MKQTVKKITSLVLVLALSLVFLPLRADASTISTEKNTEASQTLFRAQGNEISSAMRAELEKRSIPVKEDTIVKIISSGNGQGTAIQALNIDGNTATLSILTAIDEEGQSKTFTTADMAQTRGSGGDSVSTNPFNDSFSITFMISFNYYSDGKITTACIQPLTAMYIYYDSSQLYTVTSLRMDYDCTGYQYKKDPNSNKYIPIGNGYNPGSHTITVNRTNPSRSTYYSNTSNRYPDGFALWQSGGMGGTQDMTYDLVAVRNRDNKKMTKGEHFYFTWDYPFG